MTAEQRWQQALAAWAIPPEILAAAPVSPWGYAPSLFARRADAAARGRLTPSGLRAREALPDGGSVLDVGCGGGAATLPLLHRRDDAPSPSQTATPTTGHPSPSQTATPTTGQPSPSQTATPTASQPSPTQVDNQAASHLLPTHGTELPLQTHREDTSSTQAPYVRHCIGVDPSEDMLQEYKRRVTATKSRCTAMHGLWPAIARQTPIADVVLCHHVLYNVADLSAFLRALTDHARVRVVVEVTARHPLSDLNGLWQHFYGLTRPTAPTVDDIVAVLHDLGLQPQWQLWEAPGLTWLGSAEGKAELVAWTRQRLCLTPASDAELASLLAARWIDGDGTVSLPQRTTATLWWSGSAA